MRLISMLRWIAETGKNHMKESGKTLISLAMISVLIAQPSPFSECRCVGAVTLLRSLRKPLPENRRRHTRQENLETFSLVELDDVGTVEGARRPHRVNQPVRSPQDDLELFWCRQGASPLAPEGVYQTPPSPWSDHSAVRLIVPWLVDWVNSTNEPIQTSLRVALLYWLGVLP